MKRIIAPLAGSGLLGLCLAGFSAGAASAASPAYCALYAKEYARHAATESQGSLTPDFLHDRAYHRCLNLDDEPAMPTAYSDPQMDGIGGPYVEEGGFAVDEAAADAGGTASVASSGSSDWQAWCRQHYPNSFDPATGTVIPLDTGRRVACPAAP